MRKLCWSLCHPDALAIGNISSRWLMGIAGCHPDDWRYCPISSRWHNVIWHLSNPDELAPGHISSGWLLDTALCHPDDISYHHMSSGWLSRNWYLIRMSYDNVNMSSGWHTLPFLSHPDEIANFDFPQHAVALQRFRRFGQELPGERDRCRHIWLGWFLFPTRDKIYFDGETHLWLMEWFRRLETLWLTFGNVLPIVFG